MANENLPAAIQEKAVRNVDRLKTALYNPESEKQFLSALGDQKKMKAFQSSLIDLFVNDNTLQACEPKQIMAQALRAANLKLPVNKSLGFFWIIPYKRSIKRKDAKGNVIIFNGKPIWDEIVQPEGQVGYKGYIQLAIRTGEYKFINADVVYEGQLIDHDMLSGEIVLDKKKKSSDKVLGYFAHFELLAGFKKTLYSTVDEVRDHAKKYSKSYDPSKKDNIWVKEFDSMAKKTVLSYLLSHYGYLSIEMEAAISEDIEADATYNIYGEQGAANPQDNPEMGFSTAEVISSNKGDTQQPESEDEDTSDDQDGEDEEEEQTDEENGGQQVDRSGFASENADPKLGF